MRSTAERLARIPVFGVPLAPVPPISAAAATPLDAAKERDKPWRPVAARVFAHQMMKATER
jgi:hypothetical protein